MLSHTFFTHYPEEFFDFYRDKLLHLDAQPNQAHLALAELEKRGRLKAIVTQNIDGLHQAAGSRVVWELHGSVLRNHCMKCGKAYEVSAIAGSTGVPRCECGGIIKPDVVLYEEGLDEQVMRQAAKAIRSADMLIVGGTSLMVYPAAGFIDYYDGDRLVLINKTTTPLDGRANLVIHSSISAALADCLH
jgi:NAD-dependent deacetylase